MRVSSIVFVVVVFIFFLTYFYFMFVFLIVFYILDKPLFTLDPTNVSSTSRGVANEDEMSYRTNDLPQISRHLSETPNSEG